MVGVMVQDSKFKSGITGFSLCTIFYLVLIVLCMWEIEIKNLSPQDNDDEELPEDELPEWKREPPKVDLSQLDPNNPELMLQASKKGRTLMMFATVSGSGNFYLTSLVIES